MVGKLISHYKILAELGRGGMGIVYKAEDTRLGRPVAIKVLPPAALANDEDRARFYREAKASAQLQHAHIASVFAIDEAVPSDAPPGTEPSPFIAMEFIDGSTLEEIIQSGPLTLSEAIRIGSEAASGLQAAHEKNIVHRDIKAGNIMLAERGITKVLDFGLAQTAASTKLTKMGSTLGTVAYMSPEQARGEAVDHRTDVWSLGVVLYEMVSGKHPFPGSYEQAVIYEILNQDPQPLTALRTGVPMQLERIVSKCLAKKADMRYQHMDDLIVDLAGVDVDRESSVDGRISEAHSHAGHTQPVVIPMKNWRFAAIVAATALIASLGMWIWLGGSGGEANVRVAALTRITTESVVEMNPSIHPAGDRIVYAAGKIYDMRLYSRLIQGGPPRRLVENSEVDQQYPSYSPDGNLVLFESEGSIYSVEALGGVPRPIILRPNESSLFVFPTWSPTGGEIAFSDYDSLYVLTLGQQSPRLTVPIDRVHSLSWSPDGKFIAFVRLNTAHAKRATNIAPSSLWLVDSSNGARHRITSDEFMDMSPDWGPDGSSLFYISNRGGGLDIYRQKISPKGEPVDTPLRITTGLSLHSMRVSRDGSKLAVSDLRYQQNVWASDIRPGEVSTFRDAIPITSGQQVIEGIAISPDGTKLAFDSNARGIAHLFVMSLSGGFPFQVTARDEPDFLFDWSPYSDEFAFHTFHEGSRDVGVVSTDGLRMHMVATGPGQDVWPIWMGDKDTIGFQRFNPEGSDDQFFMVRRDESGNWSEPELLLENYIIGARWSVVRNKLAYIAGRTLYLWDPLMNESTALLDDDVISGFEFELNNNTAIPIWSETGEQIYVKMINGTGNHSFWSVSPDDGSHRMVLDLTGAQTGIGLPAVHNDRFYYTVSIIESDIWALDLATE